MKSPATIIATAALVVALGGNAAVYKINEAQQDTAELAARTAINTNNVLCEQRTDLRARYAEAAAFLKLTPEERVAKYGSVLGSIPDSVVQSQQASRRAQLAVLDELICLKEG